jgi:glycosyltransferase 2 family protein
MLNKIIKWFFTIVTILSFYYIYRVIRKLNINWGILFTKNIFMIFLASLLIMVVCLYISSFSYRKNMELLSGIAFDRKIIDTIFIKANIGKYFPGNVFHYAGRNVLGQKFNIDQKVLLGSTILLHLETITISLLIPLVEGFKIYKDIYQLLKNSLGPAQIYITAGIIVAGVVVVIVFRKFLFRFLGDLKNSLQQEVLGKLLGNFLAMTIYLILYGISFLIIALSVSKVEPSFANLAYIVVSFILAWLCGLVVIGAPGGLGIREVVLLFLLKSVFVESDLVVAVVLHRFCTTLADIVNYGIIIIKEKLNKEKSCPIEDSKSGS